MIRHKSEHLKYLRLSTSILKESSRWFFNSNLLPSSQTCMFIHQCSFGIALYSMNNSEFEFHLQFITSFDPHEFFVSFHIYIYTYTLLTVNLTSRTLVSRQSATTAKEKENEYIIRKCDLNWVVAVVLLKSWIQHFSVFIRELGAILGWWKSE